MSESTSQLNIGAKLDGSFEQTTNTVKTKVKELGSVATETGKSLAGMGAGTANSAQKVEQATKSMIQSIQRTTAATEAGDKSSRAYQESLARIRGVDVAALKPYLDQLDAVKAKQLTAASAAKSYENSFAGIKTAAVAAGAALAGFGLAVGKLVSVQREFDVLNSSLITVTGSSAAAAREMQWIKDFAKETPFGLAQATQGFVKMKALGLDPTRASLTSFGNTASAMGKDLNQMIEAVADASTGEFERLKEFGIKAKKEGDNVSLTFQGITTTIGNSATEITQYLEKLGSVEFAGAMAERAKTLDGAISELGDTWDELFRTINTNNTGSLIYDSITLATAAIGDATTIINAMTGAASANAKETGAMATIQSGIATVFETVAVVGANLKFVLVGIGNEIGGLAAQVGQAAQFNFGGVRAIREQMVADAKSARAEIDATTARILGARDAAKELASYNTRNAGAQADPSRLDTATAAEAATKATKATTAAIKENTDARRIQDERIRLSRALAIADGKAVEDANDAYKKMMDDLAKANDKYIESLNKSADSIAENVLKLNDEETALRISTEQNISLAQAIEGITIKRLEEKRVMELIGNNDAAAQAIAREIEQRKLLANAIDSKDARESVKKSAADAAAEWKRTSDSINSTLTDALMRGFESGKGFARNLRDTVVNMFKTMVLRPIISAVMSPISGAITGAMGLSGAAQAGQAVSTGSSLLSAASMASSLAGIGSTIAGAVGTAIGSFTGGLVAANAATVTLLTGSAASAAAAATAAATAGGAAATAATAAATAGSTAAASLMAVAAPAAIAVAVLAAFGAFRTTKQTGTGISGTLGDDASLTGFNEMRKSGYLFGGPKYWDEIKAIDPLMAKALKADFTAIKAAATGAADALGLASTSVAGFNKAFRIEFTGDKAKDESLYKDLMAGVSEDLARTIIGSYKETITTVIDEITSGAGPWWDGDAGMVTGTVERQVKTTAYTPSEFAREGETASQTLTRLSQSITLVNGTSDMLGNKLTEVGLKGANTASLLIDAFGGAERYAAQMGAYYQNFYTQEEQRAKLIENTSEAFTALGKTMPVLDGGARAAYRSMVELAAGQDMSVESNRTAYASLLALQGPMNELAPAFDAAGSSVSGFSDALKALQAKSADLQIELLQAQGKTSEAAAAIRARDIAGYKALEIAAYDYNATLTAQISATNAAAAASKAYTDAVQAVIDDTASILEEIGLVGKSDFDRELARIKSGGEKKQKELDRFSEAQAQANALVASTADKAALAQKTLKEETEKAAKAVADAAKANTNAVDPANALAGAVGGLGGAFSSAAAAAIAAAAQLQASAAASSNTGSNGGFGGIQNGMATGGRVYGPGSSTSDSVPTMLSAGEFVVKASSVNKYGTDFLNALNDGALSGTRRLSTGGSVDDYIQEMYDNDANRIAAGGPSVPITDAIVDMWRESFDTSVRIIPVREEIAANIGGGYDWGSSASSPIASSPIASSPIQGNTAAELLRFFKEQQQVLKDQYGASPTSSEARSNLASSRFSVSGLDESGIKKYFADLAASADVTTEAGKKTIQDISNLSDSISVLGEVAQERAGLQNELNSLTDTSAQALSRQRDALDESNRTIFDAIQAIKAEAAAKEAVKAAASDAFSALQRAVDSERKIVQTARAAAAEAISEVSSVFGVLKSSIKDLYSSTSSTSKMQATQGRSFITDALEAAKNTGYLPDSKALADAISAVKNGQQEFASQFEKDFSTIAFAGELSQLEAISGTQLTQAEAALKVQEDQLAALDSVLSLAKQQLDQMSGINTSVLGVQDALDAFNAIYYSQNRLSRATAGFSVGINRVPYDMTARIHEGEAIVPAAFNPFNPGATQNGLGGNSARTEALLEGLTKEVQRLQSIVNDGNRQATRTADATNGRPEMPMLVETV